MSEKPVLDYAESKPAQKPRMWVTVLIWVVFLAICCALYASLDFIPRHK
jgi:hypothetical protein